MSEASVAKERWLWGWVNQGNSSSKGRPSMMEGDSTFRRPGESLGRTGEGITERLKDTGGMRDGTVV